MSGIHFSNRGRISARGVRAFTLVELLVVIGIIGLLISIILPALAAARAEGRAIVCLSNVRQIGHAITMYIGDFKKLPPNIGTPAPGQWWIDDARVAPYLLRINANPDGPSVLVCPSDDDAARSYAMNFWASSRVDGSATSGTKWRLWKLGSRYDSQLMLVTEAWSSQSSAPGAPWVAPQTVGTAGTKPGQKFGGLAGTFNAKRFGMVSSELPYYRHRMRQGGTLSEPVGRIAICYADGHAGLRKDTDLFNATTGFSTLDSLWSPDDQYLDN